MEDKSSAGNYFEDFALKQTIQHATPRTITAGDCALYTALTGSRFILQSSNQAAQSVGHQNQLVDDIFSFSHCFW